MQEYKSATDFSYVFWLRDSFLCCFLSRSGHDHLVIITRVINGHRWSKTFFVYKGHVVCLNNWSQKCQICGCVIHPGQNRRNSSRKIWKSDRDIEGKSQMMWKSVFRIRLTLIRIWIRGSVFVNNGSGSGSRFYNTIFSIKKYLSPKDVLWANYLR